MSKKTTDWTVNNCIGWEIYAQWADIWDNTGSGEKSYPLFKKLFFESYMESCKKATRNREKNFKCKKIFLLVYAILPVLIVMWKVIGRIVYACRRKDWSVIFEKITVMDVGVYGGVIIGSTLFVTWMVAKWLDIKKYQETWVRHEYCQYNIEKEMTLFILGLNGYEAVCRKELFIKNIYKIWDGNQKKFIDNMEQREVSMKDVLKFWRK